jgi:hypothetical protein
MQAAEFPSLESAKQCEAALSELYRAYVNFEATDPSPWSFERVPGPLLDFGKKFGVEWPLKENSRILLKGGFEDTAELMRIDRIVFFWGGGFDLGGETLREILVKMGAKKVTDSCYITIQNSDPDMRLEELVAFLNDEDYEDQYEVDPADFEFALHAITIAGPNHSRSLAFDESGVQDWAFVALLPQLDGEDPCLK